MKRPFMVWIGFISICCSKVAKEGKRCSRLLVLQRVAQNAESCSKVAEHNLFMPTSNSHPAERISQFFDHHLQPLVTKFPGSYINDTIHLNLNKLNNMSQILNSVLLVTLNVTSLYMNIPTRTESKLAATFWTHGQILLSIDYKAL